MKGRWKIQIQADGDNGKYTNVMKGGWKIQIQADGVLDDNKRVNIFIFTGRWLLETGKPGGKS